METGTKKKKKTPKISNMLEKMQNNDTECGNYEITADTVLGTI